MAKASTAQTKPNFASVLDEPAAEAKRPPTIPRGYYVTAVQPGYRIDKSSEKQTEFVEYTLKVLSVWEKDGIPQVDEDELAEFGDVTGQLIRVTFWMTDKSKYRLKEFFEHCGLEVEPGMSFAQLIPEVVGCQVIAAVAHEPARTGEGVFARVRSTAPVEE